MQSLLGSVLVLTTVGLCCIARAEQPNRRFPEKEYADALEREMIEAAFHGKIDVVKDCLAKGARINARYGGDSHYFKGENGGWPISGFNWTALMAATENDHFEIAELLITKGATVKIDDGWGATPLYGLAEKRNARKEYDALAALFIKNGANVNAKTEVYLDGPSGETVLHEAVGWGHIQIVKLLVAAGADVNAQDSDGRTPLDEVVSGRNDLEIRAVLEKAGATKGKRSR